MSPHNRAAWLKEKQAPVMVVEDAPWSQPEANEVVIKVKAIAINPADYIIQRLGILVQHYPAILGCDAAGVIEEVGPDVDNFKPGDRVFGSCSPLMTKDGVYAYSAFQHYVVLKMPYIAKIPDQAEFKQAAVLPLGVTTATSCLFAPQTLGLEVPPTDAGRGKTVIIFGASSSVGSCGVQLATAAGYEVIGVASRHNHDFVKSIGATECFDQKDATLVDDMLSFLKGKDVVGAYDAVSTDDTLGALCDILSRCDGRKLICAVRPGAEASSAKGVKIVTNFAVAPSSQPELGRRIWQEFLEPALAKGSFQYKPDPEVVGEGLEHVQKACDLLSKGVSAKKLVITL